MNDLEEPMPEVRVTIVLPAGHARVDGGRPEIAIAADDGKFVILVAGVDVPARGKATLTAVSER